MGAFRYAALRIAGEKKKFKNNNNSYFTNCGTCAILCSQAVRKSGRPYRKGRAEFYHDQVVPAMEALREPVDELEMLVDKEMWPMPSYGDLLFEV